MITFIYPFAHIVNFDEYISQVQKSERLPGGGLNCLVFPNIRFHEKVRRFVLILNLFMSGLLTMSSSNLFHVFRDLDTKVVRRAPVISKGNFALMELLFLRLRVRGAISTAKLLSYNTFL